MRILLVLLLFLSMGACGDGSLPPESPAPPPPPPPPPPKPKVEYASVTEVRQDLDCDTGLSNEGKAHNMRNKYKDKRVIFNGNIIRLEGSEVTISGMLGSGVFSGFPLLYLESEKVARDHLIAENATYKFDCKIVDYCEDGFMDGNLVFNDCDVVK